MLLRQSDYMLNKFSNIAEVTNSVDFSRATMSSQFDHLQQVSLRS